MSFVVLVCAFALLVSPYFFAYYEAERMLGWPQTVYLCFDPWLSLVMILVAALTAFALPWIVSLFCDRDHRL
jgi:hypothetical protein